MGSSRGSRWASGAGVLSAAALGSPSVIPARLRLVLGWVCGPVTPTRARAVAVASAPRVPVPWTPLEAALLSPALLGWVLQPPAPHRVGPRADHRLQGGVRSVKGVDEVVCSFPPRGSLGRDIDVGTKMRSARPRLAFSSMAVRGLEMHRHRVGRDAGSLGGLLARPAPPTPPHCPLRGGAE